MLTTYRDLHAGPNRITVDNPQNVKKKILFWRKKVAFLIRINATLMALNKTETEQYNIRCKPASVAEAVAGSLKFCS